MTSPPLSALPSPLPTHLSPFCSPLSPLPSSLNPLPTPDSPLPSSPVPSPLLLLSPSSSTTPSQLRTLGLSFCLCVTRSPARTGKAAPGGTGTSRHPWATAWALVVSWRAGEVMLAGRRSSLLLVSRSEVMINRDSWGHSYVTVRGEIWRRGREAGRRGGGEAGRCGVGEAGRRREPH